MAKVDTSKIKVLYTNFGHDGFLIECVALGMAVSRFLGGQIGNAKSTGTPAFHSEKDISIIDSLIPAKARILDLGAGDGLLIDSLWQKKKVTGVGVEKNFANILGHLPGDGLRVQSAKDDTALSFQQIVRHKNVPFYRY